jgi:hypothetical protein
MEKLREMELENARLRAQAAEPVQAAEPAQATEPAPSEVDCAQQMKLTDFPGLITWGTPGTEIEDSFIRVPSKHCIRLARAIAEPPAEAATHVATRVDTDVVPDVCIVCQDSFDSDDGRPSCELNCKHSSHYECIQRWVMSDPLGALAAVLQLESTPPISPMVGLPW